MFWVVVTGKTLLIQLLVIKIEANANVTSDWFNCNIDPAPPQFWNRLPLLHLNDGAYELNINLSGPNQSDSIQLLFTVRGTTEPQPVPSNNLIALLCLIVLFLLSATIKRVALDS